MVKVREFCCGCSLRSGTFIIAWASLVINCSLFIYGFFSYLSILRQSKTVYRYQTSYDMIAPPSVLIFLYNMARMVAGIAVSIIAIWAIQKNKVKFLNGLLWYLGFYAGTLGFSAILVLFVPAWELALSEENPVISSVIRKPIVENIVFLFLVYLFGIGISAYFALVVKSFRDYTLRNDAQNAHFVGPDPTAVGFLAA